MSKLYVVPTPIGNLRDMTFRAAEVLGMVDLILSEDTRESRKLLNHYKINTPLQSHHKFNEHRSVGAICSKIEAGTSIALISDAGTPAISDPGFLLVRTCIRRGIEVETLPGATAFVPALVNSGLPCDRFVLEGFLPRKGRRKRLTELSEEKRTMVFYESPYRLVRTLDDLASFFGPERDTSVSRELTKIHEENVRGTLVSVADHYRLHQPKGEVVIVVSGKNDELSDKNTEE